MPHQLPDLSLYEDRITPEEAAKRLKIAPRTLSDWRRRRVGPPFIRLDNGRVAYRRSEVESFAKARQVAPELTGRSDQPVLQRRIEQHKVAKKMLTERNAELEQHLRAALADKAALLERSKQFEASAGAWHKRAQASEVLLGNLRDEVVSLRGRLDERDKIVEMLAESDELVLARHAREVGAGRDEALPAPITSAASVTLAQMARERLLVLYSGKVKAFGGGLEPLGQRTPAQAVLESGGFHKTLELIKKLSGR